MPLPSDAPLLVPDDDGWLSQAPRRVIDAEAQSIPEAHRQLFEHTLDVSRSYLLAHQPFFVRLVHFLDVQPSLRTRSLRARRDGLVFVNPLWFAQTLSPHERIGVLAFSAMLVALRCGERGSGKRPVVWRRAVAAVLAGHLAGEGLRLPRIVSELAVQLPSPAGWSDDALYFEWSADLGYGPEPDEWLRALPMLPAALEATGQGGVGEPALVWNERLRTALAFSSGQLRGTLPGHLKAVLEATAVKPLPWPALLRSAVRRALRNRRRSLTPHRRKSWALAGLVAGTAPVIRLGHRHTVGRVDIALDTSGSMLWDERMERALGVIDDLLRHLRVPSRLIQCDAEVQTTEKLRSAQTLTIEGGGGTSSTPVFDLIASEPHPPAALVFVTDLATDFPDRAPPYPVIWVVIDPWDVPAQVPFGTAVLVDPKREAPE